MKVDRWPSAGRDCRSSSRATKWRIWREALVTSYDPEYKATKLIRQGKAALEPEMADLADWVSSRWQVTVLNVIYDQIEVSSNRRPRLQVIVEHSHELQEFFDGHNFDLVKQQAIAARFVELVTQQRPTRYDADGLLVVFSAFAPLGAGGSGQSDCRR